MVIDNKQNILKSVVTGWRLIIIHTKKMVSGVQSNSDKCNMNQN